jgi:hypothetical protein
MQLRQKVKQLILQQLQDLIVDLLFLTNSNYNFKEIYRSEFSIKIFIVKRMETRQMSDEASPFNWCRWLEGRLPGRSKPATPTRTNLIIPVSAPDKLKNWFRPHSEFCHKSLTNTSVALSFYYKKEKKERVAQYSFILPFILSKVDLAGRATPASNIKVEPVGDSYYLSVFLLSLVALSCFYNVMAYFISLYLIQHYNVRVAWLRPARNFLN